MRMLHFVTLCISLACLAGCGETRVVVHSIRPPKVIDLAKQGIDTIAVAEIRDPQVTSYGLSGYGIGDQTTGMIQAALNALGTFDVLNRSDVRAMLNQSRFNMSGWVDEKTGADSFELTGTKILMIGQIHSYSLTQSLGTSYDSNGTVYYFRRGKAVMEMTTKIIDIQSGKIVAVIPVNIIKELRNPRSGAVADRPASYDVQQVMLPIRQEAVAEVMHSIAPYKEAYVVILEKDGKIPGLENGNRLAAIGSWEDAAYEYEQAAQSNPDSDKSYYNLGISKRALGDLEDAEQCLKKAYQIKPRKKYLMELQRNKQFITKP